MSEQLSHFLSVVFTCLNEARLTNIFCSSENDQLKVDFLKAWLCFNIYSSLSSTLVSLGPWWNRCTNWMWSSLVNLHTEKSSNQKTSVWGTSTLSNVGLSLFYRIRMCSGRINKTLGSNSACAGCVSCAWSWCSCTRSTTDAKPRSCYGGKFITRSSRSSRPTKRSQTTVISLTHTHTVMLN